MKIQFKRRRKSDVENKYKKASEWLLDIKSESLPSQLMDDFPDWIEEDQTNQSKLDLMASVWNSMDELKDDPLIVQTVEESVAKEKEHTTRKEKWTSNILSNFTTFRYAAVAATFLFIVGGIGLIQTNIHQAKIHKTTTGEQKIVYLADGSTIHIDTNTVVETSFTEKFRHVELIKGKAYFSVAHEPDRPFIVKTGLVTIRALGTEFEVYKKKKEKITIVVTKGRVHVSQKDEKHLPINQKLLLTDLEKRAKPEQKLMARKGEILESGQEMEVDTHKIKYVTKSLYTNSVNSVKSVNAWKEGRLNFQNKPLFDVIEELNRYVDNKIIIGDETLKNININVYFKIKNRKDFVTTLAKAFPAISHTVSNGRIVLVKKEGI